MPLSSVIAAILFFIPFHIIIIIITTIKKTSLLFVIIIGYCYITVCHAHLMPYHINVHYYFIISACHWLFAAAVCPPARRCHWVHCLPACQLPAQLLPACLAWHARGWATSLHWPLKAAARSLKPRLPHTRPVTCLAMPTHNNTATLANKPAAAAWAACLAE